MNEALMTYAEAVERLVNDPESEPLVRACYFDRDLDGAAKRFRESEEFGAIRSLLADAAARLGRAMSNRLDVLEVGCGRGYVSWAIADLGHAVTGVDPDPTGAAGIGAFPALPPVREPGSLRGIRAVAEALPFADDSFDVVIARQVLHHFGDLRHGLAECGRVLRKGGTLLALREHVVRDDEDRARFLEAHPLHRMHGGEWAYTLAEYESAITAAGFATRRTLGSFDSVINHYPIENGELLTWLESSLERRLGRLLAPILSRVGPVERWYRRRLSKNDPTPGRMCSFVAWSRR